MSSFEIFNDCNWLLRDTGYWLLDTGWKKEFFFLFIQHPASSVQYLFASPGWGGGAWLVSIVFNALRKSFDKVLF